MADNHPALYFEGMVQLCQVMKVELGSSGDFAKLAAGFCRRPQRRFSFKRQLSPRIVTVWLWWRRRSRIPVAATGSRNAAPHSPTLRLLLGRIAPLLIAAADELEEQVRRVGLEWQITKFIGDFSGAPRVLELEP
jgi:hypothetical protein